MRSLIGSLMILASCGYYDSSVTKKGTVGEPCRAPSYACTEDLTTILECREGVWVDIRICDAPAICAESETHDFQCAILRVNHR
jgi:hypothetical protein